ncbi:hypothetical protein HNY73_011233 [Argiope bruennichi]|uniref:DUF5641 domain-containing protein n=1 Tax=Argiope bruennichi TaxID=94029 RepID=A0A8T0F4F0_ARGBR|nr:hypothetical protein HNY73_011233 [Argiope bruennichi]
MKNHPEWLVLIKWAIGFSNSTGIFDPKTTEMIDLLCQEMNLIERRENFFNPYRKYEQQVPKPNANNFQPKPKKVNIKKGPRMSKPRHTELKRRENGIPDLDHLELSPEYFRKRWLYRCKLQEDIRNRFRLEYLGQLRQQTKKMIKPHDFKVGEAVIVEVTNQKRLNWPLGKITEIFPGKDGSVRLVKVKTKNGEFLRPVQHLYALEVQTPSVENLLEKRASEIEDEKEEAVQQQYVEHPEKLPESDETSLPNLNTMKTRFGRKIQVPKRVDL